MTAIEEIRNATKELEAALSHKPADIYGPMLPRTRARTDSQENDDLSLPYSASWELCDGSGKRIDPCERFANIVTAQEFLAGFPYVICMGGVIVAVGELGKVSAERETLVRWIVSAPEMRQRVQPSAREIEKILKDEHTPPKKTLIAAILKQWRNAKEPVRVR